MQETQDFSHFLQDGTVVKCCYLIALILVTETAIYEKQGCLLFVVAKSNADLNCEFD